MLTPKWNFSEDGKFEGLSWCSLSEVSPNTESSFEASATETGAQEEAA